MIRNALLAFGIVMAFATQLPVPGLPITLSHLALLLWILLSVGRILAGHRLIVTAAFKRLCIFWLGLALSLCLGTVVGYFRNDLSLADALHDTVSYVLLALVTCLPAAEPNAADRLPAYAWYVVIIGQLALAAQVGLAWGLFHQSGVDLWYWGVRFQGWSENPNQLALYCAVLGPLALHVATTTKNSFGKIGGLLGLILPFYVGRLTQSDTYLLTAVPMYLIFLVLQLRTGLSPGSSKASFGRQVAIVVLLTSISLSLALVPYGLAEFGNVQKFAQSLTRGKGGPATDHTAALRLHLWDSALVKGLYSGSLGLGPGPHVDRPAAESGKGPAMTVPKEAHNTILDLYTQGGLIAVLLLFWIVGSAALCAWRAKFNALFALIASLAVFSIFHLTIRHPIVWFPITLCLATGIGRSEARGRSSIPTYAHLPT
jgi:hypothetical protein